MTPNELRALADALEPMANAPRFEDFDVPVFCAWARACADAEPVARIYTDAEMVHRDERWGRVQWIEPESELAEGTLLYTHPAPAPQAEPKREPLSDERIDEIGDPFGYFQYGDAQGDKRRAFARAVERAVYERAAQECDPHEDDDRIDRQIKREIAERIRALGRQHGHQDGPATYQFGGMTLRDYFAARAMQGLMANKSNPLHFNPEDDAAYVYRIADAMLKARESA